MTGFHRPCVSPREGQGKWGALCMWPALLLKESGPHQQPELDFARPLVHKAW